MKEKPKYAPVISRQVLYETMGTIPFEGTFVRFVRDTGGGEGRGGEKIAAF